MKTASALYSELELQRNQFLVGQIAEIVMYNRAVTGTERQQVEAYLMDKYAITAV